MQANRLKRGQCQYICLSYLSAQAIFCVIEPYRAIETITQCELAHKPVVSFLSLGGHAFYFVRVAKVSLKVWICIAPRNYENYKLKYHVL